MKKMLSFMFAIFTLLILGCDEYFITEATNTEATNKDRVHGSVHGIVTDNNTGDVLEGIKLSWIFDGEVQTAETDENGWYFIDELIPGTHTIIFSGVDPSLSVQYSVGSKDIIIPKLEELVAIAGAIDKRYEKEPDGSYYIEIVEDITMYSMNGNAMGYIYLEVDAEEITFIASDVTVIAEYTTHGIIPSQYTTITNSLGGYSFSNIPAADNVTFKIEIYNNGTYTYEGANTIKSLLPDQIVQVDHIILDTKVASAPILLSNNFENNDFQVGDNITGTFNVAIDHTVNNFAMTFNRDNPAENGHHSGDYVITWSTDGKTFTIDPDEGLAFETAYMIEISGNTSEGQSFDWSVANSETALIFTTQVGVVETSTNLESYDGSGKVIGKNDAIVFTFSETLMTTQLDMIFEKGTCSGPGTFTTQSTCLCGDNGIYNTTTATCTEGNSTDKFWSGYFVVTEECNVVVDQWDFEEDRSVDKCVSATFSSTDNTVTLTAPENGWSYKCDANNDGACVGTITYPDIIVTYKYVSSLAAYDEINNGIGYTIEIVD